MDVNCEDDDDDNEDCIDGINGPNNEFVMGIFGGIGGMETVRGGEGKVELLDDGGGMTLLIGTWFSILPGDGIESISFFPQFIIRNWIRNKIKINSPFGTDRSSTFVQVDPQK